MMDIEPMDNDIRIELDGSFVLLSELLNYQTHWVERYMCKDNAETVYDIAVNLECFARDLREQWEKWKYNDFKKLDGGQG
jgi:hypothetical protein